VHFPSTWRLPFGYVVEIRLVSPSYLRRVAGGDCRGCWVDFGLLKSNEKVGRIYIDKTMDEANLMDTFKHEVNHMITDYLGKVWQP
jgi:hypothetical protein